MDRINENTRIFSCINKGDIGNDGSFVYTMPRPLYIGNNEQWLLTLESISMPAAIVNTDNCRIILLEGVAPLQF